MENYDLLELAIQKLELMGFDEIGKIIILREHTSRWVMEHEPEQINDWYDGFTKTWSLS